MTKRMLDVLAHVVGYIWYGCFYSIIIPILVVVVGQNLDLLFLKYLLNRSEFMWAFPINTLCALPIFIIGGSLIMWSFVELYVHAGCFPFEFLRLYGHKPKRLATLGPYKTVRHPMLLGYLIVLTALGIYIGSLFTVIWVVPLLGWVCVEYVKHFEEKRLKSFLGKEYEHYQKTVSLIFPRLKRGR